MAANVNITRDMYKKERAIFTYQISDDAIERFFFNAQSCSKYLRRPFFHFLSEYCTVIQCYGFSINMRVILTGDIHVEEFSKSLLQIGRRILNVNVEYITIAKTKKKKKNN